MARTRRTAKYPPLTIHLSPHVHARLQAASTVLRAPVEELIESALEYHLRNMEEDKLELIDRVAASLLTRTELGSTKD
jgi:hypothetical protein